MSMYEVQESVNGGEFKTVASFEWHSQAKFYVEGTIYDNMTHPILRSDHYEYRIVYKKDDEVAA